MSEHPLRIAIVGGGLGGLTLALTLGKAQEEGANIQVTIYEAAAAFAEIGAGISIGRNSVKVLEQLGLGEAYARIADFSDHLPDDCEGKNVYFEWRRWNTGAPIGRTMVEHHSYVHRARFLDCILAAVPNCVERKFNKRLSKFSTQNDETTLEFGDGSTAVADCVIACDGIKSVVRAALHPPKDGADAKALAASGYPEPRLPAMYFGKDKHILAFTVDQGKTTNVVAFVTDRSKSPNERKWEGHPRLKGKDRNEEPVPWVEPVDKQFMMDDYEGWCPDIQKLLNHIDKPTCWALHELTNLQNWVFGRVALMGDAASATLPHQGSGAGQAIESGYVLGRLLSDPKCTRDTVERYLQVYQTVRKERHDAVTNTSRENGDVMELSGFGSVKGLEGKPLRCETAEGWQDLAEEMAHRHDWIFYFDANETVKKALELMDR